MYPDGKYSYQEPGELSRICDGVDARDPGRSALLYDVAVRRQSKADLFSRIVCLLHYDASNPIQSQVRAGVTFLTRMAFPRYLSLPLLFPLPLPFSLSLSGLTKRRRQRRAEELPHVHPVGQLQVQQALEAAPARWQQIRPRHVSRHVLEALQVQRGQTRGGCVARRLHVGGFGRFCEPLRDARCVRGGGPDTRAHTVCDSSRDTDAPGGSGRVEWRVGVYTFK